jgi:hypothetical protein
MLIKKKDEKPIVKPAPPVEKPVVAPPVLTEKQKRRMAFLKKYQA